MPTRRLAALALEGDRLVLAVGRAREKSLETVDFIEETPSVGLHRGMIVDTELFTDSLDHLSQALEQVTRVTGLDRIVCGVHGPYVHIQLLTRSFPIPGGGPLGQEEVDHTVRETALKAADDRMLLHVMPWRFLLDNYRETSRPSGLRAEKLTVEALGVFADPAPLADVQDVLDELGLGGAEIVFSPLTAARTLLPAEERQHGVVWVDFAWDETRVSIYHKRRLYLFRTIDKGVADLAETLSRSIPETAPELRRIIRKVDVHESASDSPGGMARTFLRDQIAEARAFVDESSAAFGGGPFAPTWVLSGAVADARGVQEEVAGRVDQPVRVARVPEALSVRGHDQSQSASVVALLAAAAREPVFNPAGNGRNAWSRFRTAPTRIWRQLRARGERIGL